MIFHFNYSKQIYFDKLKYKIYNKKIEIKQLDKAVNNEIIEINLFNSINNF